MKVAHVIASLGGSGVGPAYAVSRLTHSLSELQVRVQIQTLMPVPEQSGDCCCVVGYPRHPVLRRLGISSEMRRGLGAIAADILHNNGLLDDAEHLRRERRPSAWPPARLLATRHVLGMVDGILPWAQASRLVVSRATSRGRRDGLLPRHLRRRGKGYSPAGLPSAHRCSAARHRSTRSREHCASRRSRPAPHNTVPQSCPSQKGNSHPLARLATRPAAISRLRPCRRWP